MPYVPPKMMLSDQPTAEALRAIQSELEPVPTPTLAPTTPEHAAGPGARIRRRALVPSVSLHGYRPSAKSLESFFAEE